MSQPRFVGENYSEFLGAMQFLGDKSNEEMGIAIGLKDSRHYDEWLTGEVMPHDYFQNQIASMFDLTATESTHLRAGTVRLREQLKLIYNFILEQ